MSADGKTDVNVDIGEQLEGIVSTILRIERSDVKLSGDTNLYDLGLESLNVVELLTQIEITYDITIDVEDISTELFSRFDTLVAFVQAKVDERG